MSPACCCVDHLELRHGFKFWERRVHVIPRRSASGKNDHRRPKLFQVMEAACSYELKLRRAAVFGMDMATALRAKASFNNVAAVGLLFMEF